LRQLKTPLSARYSIASGRLLLLLLTTGAYTRLLSN
jgi:hypothetical protein